MGSIRVFQNFSRTGIEIFKTEPNRTEPNGTEIYRIFRNPLNKEKLKIFLALIREKEVY